MTADILSFPQIAMNLGLGQKPAGRLRDDECICPNCGLSSPGYIIRKHGHEYISCERGCEHENGEPVEVYTQADFDEGLMNAGEGEVNKLLIAYDKATFCR